MKAVFDQYGDTIRDFFRGPDAISPKRFWALLRQDISRKRPKEVDSYLRASDGRLADIPGFGPALADKFFSPAKDRENAQLKKSQAALILATIEMDAAARLQGLADRKPQEMERAQRLAKLLMIWGVTE